MPNDGLTHTAIEDSRTDIQKIRDWLKANGMRSRLPELQYQPDFEKKGHYSRKGYKQGVKLKTKRKK